MPALSNESVGRRLTNASPPAIRSLIRRARSRLIGLSDLLRPRPDPDAIPNHLLTDAEIQSFRQIGDRFLRYFIEFGGLQPGHAVLEVGSGSGRMARPLTRYLESGSYEGLDVLPAGVRWCRRSIASRHHNFRFQVADVYNGSYNPTGRFSASEYRFPYDDQRFDFVFLTSVFTHLLPQDVEHYVSEINRVLKPGGRCLITFFLLNAESLDLLRAGRSRIAFATDHGRYLTVEGQPAEAAVAYYERYVLEVFEANGLRDPHLYYGNWCRRLSALDYQDLVVATKV
jgi:SAM-dependent methyltransferase